MTRPQNKRLNHGFNRTGFPNRNKEFAANHPLTNQLLRLQQEARITDYEWSRLVGNSGNLPSHWRSGRANPSLITFTNYAEALGYTVTLTKKET